MKLLVVIPTYNEIDNITKIIPEVFKVIPADAGVLVVDDGSPDGTAAAVKTMQKSSGGGTNIYIFLNVLQKMDLQMPI